MADHLADAGATVGLRVVDVAGQRIDEIAGEMSAIGRRQRGPLLALEVIMQDQFLAIFGQDEVNAGSLEVAVEEQLRIGNDDRTRRHMRRVLRDGLDVGVGMPVGMRSSRHQRRVWHRIYRNNSKGHR